MTRHITTHNAMAPTGICDDPRYATLALANRERYAKAEPFPHIAFDNFLDKRLALALAKSFPGIEDEIGWVINDHNNAQKKLQHDETKLPLLIRQMLREFNSRQFVLFVETLTGIESLLADPYFVGGGAHIAGRGGYLKVHADFNWHHKLQAHRRVNALLYLNEDWDEEWGGAFELWDKQMTTRVKSIYPVMNRLVVFSTTTDANHGHPTPLQTPAGVCRKTLNIYYYTTHRDDGYLTDPHFTLYKPEASSFATQISQQYKESGLGTEKK